MKKVFNIIALIICFLSIYFVGKTQNIMSKNEHYFVTLPEYKVINPIIFNVIDSISKLTTECIFCVLKKPYMFDIEIVEKDFGFFISVESMEFYQFLPNYVLKDKPEKGFFYYNDKLVIVSSNNNLSEFCIKESDSLINLTYEKTINLTPWYLKGYEGACQSYIYKEGNLTKISEIQCHKIAYIIKEIEENDTFDNLSYSCFCPNEILYYEDGKYSGKLPLIGEKLYLKFKINNIGELIIERISRKTLLEK